MLLTLFITLVFLTGFHYFIFLPIAVIIFAIIYAASGKFRLNKNNLTKIIVSILILIAVAAPIVRPYLQARTDYGFTRSTQEIIDSSPAAVNYLISPFLNYYLYKIYDYKVQIISPGIAVIVLLLLSWYIFKRKKDAIGREHKLIYGFIIIIAFLVSLGFYLVLWPGQSLKVPGIYSLFYSFIPGFNGIRETGRYSIFVLLGICVFIGYGLNGWSQKIKDIYAKVILVLTVMMLFFLESSFVPSAVYLYPEGEGGSSEVIDLYEWVSKQPEDNIFLELPMGFKRDEYLTNYDIYYVFHSKDHFRKIVNGYSGYFPPGYIQLMDIMSSFNLEPGLRLIKKLGVNYLVFHFDRYDDPSQTKNIMSEQADNSNSLRYVNNFGNNYVYQIIYD